MKKYSMHAYGPVAKCLTLEIKNFTKDIFSKRILDIGCGDGTWTNLFCANSNNVIGLDVEEAFIEKDRKFKFVKANACDLPFKKSTFDLIVSFDVIEHIKNDNLFFAESYRVLREEGELLIGTPNKNRIFNLFFNFFGGRNIYPLNLGNKSQYGEIVHEREYTPDELVEIVEKNGFTVKWMKHIWFGIFYYRLILGFSYPPKILSNYCHYILLKAAKNR